MTVHLSITENGDIKITTGSKKVRKDNLDKWLGRNRDAVLVQLEGNPEQSAPCSVGHICNIEEGENGQYNVFVGNHVIGQLPAEAIAFAEQVDYSPDSLISIVGKVEEDKVSIYIAE